MSKPLVSDDLWAVVAPLLPPEPPKPTGGRPRVPDRAALTGIVFVLRSGMPWELLPQELGRGSGMTCWRRLRDWQETGVWGALHRALPDRLGEADRIDWSRASPESATGPNPTDRGKPGAKRHVVVDRGGPPLAALLTGANRHDPAVFENLIAAIPPSKGHSGRRRKRPSKVHADLVGALSLRGAGAASRRQDRWLQALTAVAPSPGPKGPGCLNGKAPEGPWSASSNPLCG